MTIYDYLNLLNEICGIEIHIYDLNSEREVYNSADDPDWHFSMVPYSDYEICSVDIYRRSNQIVMEFNIELDEEDEDE